MEPKKDEVGVRFDDDLQERVSGYARREGLTVGEAISALLYVGLEFAERQRTGLQDDIEDLQRELRDLKQMVDVLGPAALRSAFVSLSALLLVSVSRPEGTTLARPKSPPSTPLTRPLKPSYRATGRCASLRLFRRVSLSFPAFLVAAPRRKVHLGPRCVIRLRLPDPNGTRIGPRSSGCCSQAVEGWWALKDSNLRLPPCEGGTLPLS
jgi:hypothetical protein